MNSNLYNIDAELQLLENELIEAGGEISEEMDQKLNELLDSRENKVDGYIAVIRSQKAIAEGFKKEAEWFTAKRKARENVADKLKERLYESMQARGETELKGTLGRVAIEGNGGKRKMLLHTESVDLFPMRFTITEPEIDLVALRAALETGDEEAGTFAMFAERGTHLAIR